MRGKLTFIIFFKYKQVVNGTSLIAICFFFCEMRVNAKVKKRKIFFKKKK